MSIVLIMSAKEKWAAAVLADEGAHVVLAVRNLDKGNDAKARITAKSPNAVVTVLELDLTSLDSIRKAADELRATHQRIDLLVNNAGVMYTDKASTKDGFELQFGTNHLGHFALTGLRLDNMLGVDGSRVVTISSPGHKFPDGFGEQRGHPKVVKSSAQSHDEGIQRRLWSVSEELTGVTYPV